MFFFLGALRVNSFLDMGDQFYRLLINFGNSFEADQDRQKFCPDLDPNLLDTLIVFLKQFVETTKFRNKQHMRKTYTK